MAHGYNRPQRRSSSALLILFVFGGTLAEAAFSQQQDKGNPPPPPRRQQPDERQEQMLRQMGYEWDGTKWFRGNKDAYVRGRASVKSANRFARFVAAADDDLSRATGTMVPATSPAALAASRRLEEVLRAARKDALPERSDSAKAFDRDIKNALSEPSALPFWLSVQVVVLLLLSVISGTDLAREIGNLPQTMVIGAAGGIVAAECRSKSRKCQPGIEEPTGRIERLLADGAIGSIALPEAHHVRYGNNTWKALALGGEALASTNVALLMNGIAQPAALIIANKVFVWQLVKATSGQYIGQYVAVIGAVGSIGIVALPSLIRALIRASGPIDGISAECEAASSAARGAGAYYNMSPPREADARDCAECLRRIGEGWVDAFGETSNGARYEFPIAAFFESAAYATTYYASGGSVIAPILARLLTAIDTYAVRCDPEACRANISLPDNLHVADSK